MACHRVSFEALQSCFLYAMRGVGVLVASAVLALMFPDDYAVIDFRGWRQLFNQERSSFSIGDYKKYIHEIRRLSLIHI